MEPIILASASPRRQEILKNLNIPFKIMFPSVEENIPSEMKLEDAPEYLATKKVQSVVKMFPPEQTIPWILGADTAIIYKDKLYGKPGSAAEAEEFLHTFSGHTHQVISAIALFNGKLNYLDTKVSVNQVTFKHLTDNSESNKVYKIQENEKRGKEPIIEILAHGLDEETAFSSFNSLDSFVID